MSDAKTFSLLVRAPAEVVWAVLVEKVEDPKRHTPGVESAVFAERDGDAVVRTITAGKHTFVERIRRLDDAMRIESELLEHPMFRGTSVKAVTPPASEDGFPTLTYTLDYRPANPGEELDDLMPLAMRGATHTRDIAEERAGLS